MAELKEIDRDGELTTLLERVVQGEWGCEEIIGLFQWSTRWLTLRALLEDKQTSLAQIKALLLGEPEKSPPKAEDGEPPTRPPKHQAPKGGDQDTKPKGHGRRGAADYPGCRQVKVVHQRLRPGDSCPDCVSEKRGRLHHHKPSRPLRRLRLRGNAPITGTVHWGYPLSCSKCGARFEPDWPKDANLETYDASAKAMICLMRHWYGFPCYRLEKLQRQLGIPLPDATQADLIQAAQTTFESVHGVLYQIAAQGEQFILDDTSARIQGVISERKKHPGEGRYGVRVSGILAKTAERDILLYRVGTQHAGESLEDLLAGRSGDLPPPLQMSDALAANTDHGVPPVAGREFRERIG